MSINYIFERYYFLEIIGNALYKPETILKANHKKLTYHNFITRTDDKHSDIVLLELSDEKENYQYLGKNGGVAQYP